MGNAIEIETTRLLLRPIDRTDAKAIFEYRSDSAANKYQGWIPKTINEVDEFIGKISPEINIPNTWAQFAVVLKENNQLIGDIGIHFLDTADNRQVEVGFTLNKLFRGKGYATEALAHVLSYLFNDLDKHRIIASIDPNNLDSIKVVEKLGFRKEAHFKKCILINREWTDDLVFAILGEEWVEREDDFRS